MDAPDTPLLDTIRAAMAGTSVTHVPSDLLDADMLYQRDAVLHSGSVAGPALAREQRRVLHAALSAREGEVVAAPDALGRRAMADCVATVLVDHAIADDRPPLVALLAPGDGEESASVPRLRGRWLSLPEGLAGRELYLACSDDAWLDHAKGDFLAQASRYLGRDAQGLGLHGVRMALRGRLDRINSSRMILANVVAAGADAVSVDFQIGRLAELCPLDEDEAEALRVAAHTLAEVDVALDGVREQELELATHLFECVWLEYAEGGALLSVDELEHPRSHELDALWCQLSALQPVHVVRLGRDEPGRCPVEDGFDLLCVVDAQRLDAGEALPAFSWARCALVVGEGPAPEGSLLAAATRACQWSF